MSSIKRYQQPEYKRWILILNGVYIVKDVLSAHATQVFDDFHRELIGRYGSFKCDTTNMQLVLDKPKNKWLILGEPACVHNCAEWLDAITSIHLEGARKDLFKSCDLARLSTSSWEIAKTFLTHVSRSTSSAEELDPYYLMKMITQCELFAQPSNNFLETVDKVLSTRNDFAHSAVQGIQSDEEMITKMNEMIELVQQLPNSDSTVSDLEKIRDGEMEVTVEVVQQREVCFYSDCLTVARQNSGDRLDDGQRAMLQFLKANIDLWQRMERRDKVLTAWGDAMLKSQDSAAAQISVLTQMVTENRAMLSDGFQTIMQRFDAFESAMKK